MRVLVVQSKREIDMKTLKQEIAGNPQAEVILFPEGYFQADKLEEVCQLAKEAKASIVCGYKDESGKDRAIIVDASGEIILERAKTPENERLFTPSKVGNGGKKYGYVLCREIFLGMDGLGDEPVDIIFNPIGVGMFSEDQFKEWTGEARKIAIQQQTFIVGVSHADGSYRNCGFSIPIAYCFDKDGNEVMLLKNDTRSIVFDTETGSTAFTSHFPALG